MDTNGDQRGSCIYEAKEFLKESSLIGLGKRIGEDNVIDMRLLIKPTYLKRHFLLRGAYPRTVLPARFHLTKKTVSMLIAKQELSLSSLYTTFGKMLISHLCRHRQKSREDPFSTLER